MRAFTEQKKKLVAMLAAAVDDQPVGAAPIWTLEQGLGTDFSPPVKAAWIEAYATLAGVMTQAAARAPLKAAKAG